jgi:hypothetical protein
LISIFRRIVEEPSSAGTVYRRAGATWLRKYSGSPELTAFDLLRYIHVAGGIDAVATVVADLGGKVDGDKLATMAAHFDRACAQRLGYLLDRLGHADRAQALYSHLTAMKSVPWVALEPPKRDTGASAATPIERNERWRVTVQRQPEVDD